MKMRADSCTTRGKIKSVRYAVGEQVAEGADLVEFEES